MKDARPPRPGLALRVGVIGHRWDVLAPGLPADRVKAVETALSDTVGSVLGAIAAKVRAVGADPANGYDPGRLLRLAVLCGLSEGADRIGAHAGLALGYELWALLPFAARSYSDDFDGEWMAPSWSRPGAKVEFDQLLSQATATAVLDGKVERADRYLGLGEAILRHSDLLIAIWDGKPGRGPGGTADLVGVARRDEIPIVRIDPATPGEPWLDWATDPAEGRDRGLGRLDRRIGDLVQPPELTALGGADQLAARAAFFQERAPAGFFGKAYGALTSHFLSLRGPVALALLPTWAAWVKAILRLTQRTLPDDPSAAGQADWADRAGAGRSAEAILAPGYLERLAPIHGWLDQLARYYGDRHRSAFTVIFSLAWVASVAAIVGLIAHLRHWPGAGVWGWIEAGAIGTILGLSEMGRRYRLHYRWIDYRQLAEQVRHLSFLWPLGATTSASRLAAAPSGDDPRIRWTGWYYRAIVRELGLEFRHWTRSDLDEAHHLLFDLEIPSQQRYHDEAAARLRRLHQAVHARTEWCFLAAGIVVTLHLIGAPEWIASLGAGAERVEPLAQLLSAGLTVLSVFLPARAAALHGWAGHADFQGGALRSANIQVQLERIARTGPSAALADSRALARSAEAAADAMEWELSAWWATSASRPLDRI